MIAFSQQRIGVVFLAIALALSFPALAQQPSLASSPANTSNAEQDHNEWGDENFDRQEFREEMGQIRKEHEEIEDARDALIEKCVDAKAEQAEQCQQEKQALKDRREKLHERMHALHEKMEAAHKEHHDEPNKAN